MFDRRNVMAGGLATASAALASRGVAAQTSAERVMIDAHREIGPLPHIWSKCAGSDRAAITLREDWRHDLMRFHRETGLERVRFHGIFADELGVWGGFGAGDQPNFQNVDAVYDGLIERGVDPYVELSFMPGRLMSASRHFGFYGANISPPKDLGQWQQFITTFTRHLMDRYGKARIGKWYFEVWNEPNLSFFWSGNQAQYFELYKASVAGVKAVDRDLRVGGPATASIGWIEPFLAYCAVQALPVDFVSTHIYAGDDQRPVFGTAGAYSQNDMIPAAVAKVRAQIDASPFKGTELWISEWSSDSPAMIAHVLKGALPHCQAMSQWAMSSVFEEINVPAFILKEGDNGWGMIAQRNIPKPAFNTYKLLHRLGNRQLVSTGPVLASRTEKGIAALVWNLAEAQQPGGIPGASNERKVVGQPRRLDVAIHGVRAGQTAAISYVDMARGSPFPMWRKLGSPRYPGPEQIAQIRSAAELAPPERRQCDANGNLVIDLPAEGVALIELA
ncbi:GH39 family glycosyl hydrolase [Novosphingobium sp.]|uniref:GH39 family glycosyl hydrolase n=1 Tax=Novosphingobium sp. TaxID=1874826 RepID=UPI003D0DE62F